MSVFFFKQKTAYEMRISDWSSDVCSSDLHPMTKLASRMLALTALRQGVLRTTMWSEVEGLDPEEAVWRIPAARMKLKLDRKLDARFDFMLPLSRQAVEVLEAARAYAPYSRDRKSTRLNSSH